MRTASTLADKQPPPAQAGWVAGAGGWQLQLAGAWGPAPDQAALGPTLVPTLVPTQMPWPALPDGLGPHTPVGFDTTALQAWDGGLAARLWALCAALQQQGVPVLLDGLPPGLRDALQLARAGTAAPTVARAAARRGPAQAAITVAFFGSVLLALGRLLRGRSRLRAADVLQQLDETGPRSLPIVVLTCGLVGLMLAYMGGAQLGRIGAQAFLADVVTVGMVRELAGLMTGVILAGRVGAAFAAQLATMQAGEEIDALRVLGVDPITHLVLPRLLALLLVAPALMACGALAGVAGRLAAGGAGLRRDIGRVLAPVPAGAELHPPLDRPVQGHALRGAGGAGRLPRRPARRAQRPGGGPGHHGGGGQGPGVGGGCGHRHHHGVHQPRFLNGPPPQRLRRSPSGATPAARWPGSAGPTAAAGPTHGAGGAASGAGA